MTGFSLDNSLPVRGHDLLQKYGILREHSPHHLIYISLRARIVVVLVTIDCGAWELSASEFMVLSLLSFQALPYVCLLIAMLFFIYAIIGMQVSLCIRSLAGDRYCPDCHWLTSLSIID